MKEKMNPEQKNKSALELILSDEVQSLLDNFAALIDARVTFFGPDGRRLPAAPASRPRWGRSFL